MRYARAIVLSCAMLSSMALGKDAASPDDLLKALLDKAKKGEPFALEDVATGDWDTAHFVTPYTDADRIDQRLGFKWSDPVKVKIETDDSFNLLILVKDGKVIEHYEIPRTHCDLLGVPPKPLKKGDVKLVGQTNSFGACALRMLKEAGKPTKP